jgi:hypothetical protein
MSRSYILSQPKVLRGVCWKHLGLNRNTNLTTELFMEPNGHLERTTKTYSFMTTFLLSYVLLERVTDMKGCVPNVI